MHYSDFDANYGLHYESKIYTIIIIYTNYSGLHSKYVSVPTLPGSRGQGG